MHVLLSCSICLMLSNAFSSNTVMTLSFPIDRSERTEEQSDQGLHCLVFHLHCFDEGPSGLASLFEF